MTEIVMSIKPEWVQKIFQLRKTWEVRKRRPNCDLPVKCYIWQTEGGGVVGEFICDQIEEEQVSCITKDWLKDTEISLEDAKKYAGDRRVLYKWRIRSIMEYATPKTLISVCKTMIPPQSWQYVYRGDGNDNKDS